MASDDTHKIAIRYAHALFALAEAAKALDAAEKDLAGVKALLAKSDELSRLITSPLLPRADKAKVMDALLAKLRAHDLTRKFIHSLAMNGRVAALAAIIAEFETLMTAHRGEIVLDVITASPADAGSLAAQLAKAYGGKVLVRASVDASLIGGMVLKAGGTRMDYSLKNRLTRLARTLKTQAA